MYFFVKESSRKTLMKKSSMELHEGIGLEEDKKYGSEKSITEIDVCLSEDSQATEMVSFEIFLVSSKN